ncbi:MAG: hypothetical protein ABFQ62_00700 [Patescibacteria group bacterium]
MKTSFKQLLTMFVSFFLVQSAIVYLASMLFADQVVLGTHLYSPLQGLLQSMFVLTLIMVGAMPVIELVLKRYKIKFQDKHWLLLYFVINTVAIWVVARFAEQLGFGISSWLVAVILGLIFGVDQALIVKKISSKLK